MCQCFKTNTVGHSVYKKIARFGKIFVLNISDQYLRKIFKGYMDCLSSVLGMLAIIQGTVKCVEAKVSNKDTEKRQPYMVYYMK